MEDFVPGIESWNGVDQLVGAVGSRDADLVQVIDRLGPGQVAGMLAAEIQERAEVPRSVEDTALNLRLDHDGAAYRYAVSFKDGQALVVPGEDDSALAEVGYSLLDLIRLLYPHRPGYQSTSRDVRVLRWPWGQRLGGVTPRQLEEIAKRGNVGPAQRFALGQAALARIFRSVQCLIAACSAGNASLDDLSARYGSDKWGGLHWYTPHYTSHFSPLRYDPVRILEIGIGGYKYESCGGESLYMWQRFFPRGLVYGMDLYPKPGVSGPRIRTIQGDQNDPSFLRSLAADLGPFDIIIDDGSHLNEHVRTSFEELFSCVRPGGYYVIEDLHTSYWPEFGGEAPPCSPGTTIGLLKDLVEKLHVSEYAGADLDTTQLTHPAEVCVYHDIAFLRKGISTERGIPDWIRQVGVEPDPGARSAGGADAADR
jgi:hypothetical protein